MDFERETSGQYLYRFVVEQMNERSFLDQATLSRETGVSKFTISRFLKVKGDKDIEFKAALSLMKFFDSINFGEYMDEYCLKLNKPVGIINALEFASNYKRGDLTDNLIAKHSDKKGEIKEWLEVYDLNRKRTSMSDNDVLNKCKVLYGRVSAPEIQIKLDLIEAATISVNDYQTLHYMAERVNLKVKELREGFIKDSFQIKIFSYFSYAKLYNHNDPETAISYSESIIRNSVSPNYLIGSAYVIIGQAYMFTDKTKSLKNIEKAITKFEDDGNLEFAKKLRENDIAFIKNVHKVEMDLNVLRGEELAHQLLVRNKYQEALDVLNKLPETTFSLIYKGVATCNITYLLDAYGLLVKSGKAYYKRLVEREINKIVDQNKGVLN
ncbi:AimR family lysis-lysogeny pheromone receptor [Shouchella lehensis]|uniref:Uncharacterized protein n=1 Tax=Shouchella lehensis TaxID=300825 RepID=A0A4Y7WI56_9BACI|nr:AimR family lysis-lysogeny pheromone receptor [Shouchella lehensis]MBG9785644.1 hypothetical protein [Shouchella lehensis]RQW19927.1 hypothetical protein EH196_07205 [Bacillus sp. C1-1]TES48103.1 hypothetical protein E2L03_13295 [Shouchella lehensis]